MSKTRAKSVRPATVTNTTLPVAPTTFYLARGCEHGHDVDDWRHAEHELRGALNTLVDEKVLYVKSDGAYARLTNEDDPRPRLPKADLMKPHDLTHMPPPTEHGRQCPRCGGRCWVYLGHAVCVRAACAWMEDRAVTIPQKATPEVRPTRELSDE